MVLVLESGAAPEEGYGASLVLVADAEHDATPAAHREDRPEQHVQACIGKSDWPVGVEYCIHLDVAQRAGAEGRDTTGLVAVGAFESELTVDDSRHIVAVTQSASAPVARTADEYNPSVEEGLRPCNLCHGTVRRPCPRQSPKYSAYLKKIRIKRIHSSWMIYLKVDARSDVHGDVAQIGAAAAAVGQL